MPQTTYMDVDPRRDHSFRVPRPDLSVNLGTPNACTRCHLRDERLPLVEAAGDAAQGTDGAATAEVEIRHVFVDPRERTKTPMPEAVRSVLERYSA